MLWIVIAILLLMVGVQILQCASSIEKCNDTSFIKALAIVLLPFFTIVLLILMFASFVKYHEVSEDLDRIQRQRLWK